jgi:hypothetical protein
VKALPALSALVLAAALAGCSGAVPAPSQAPANPAAETTAAAAETPKPTKPAVGKVGEPVEVKSANATAKVTIVSATYSTAPISKFDSGPAKGGYLVLDVLWETAEGSSSVNPILFSAKDPSGVQTGPRLGVTGLDNLAAADVPAGDKLRGKVVFDIAAGPWTVIVGAFTESARWEVAV